MSSYLGSLIAKMGSQKTVTWPWYPSIELQRDTRLAPKLKLPNTSVAFLPPERAAHNTAAVKDNCQSDPSAYNNRM